ncbi:hypothetical protein PanWU01x14_046010, partial [Parasponia andersonii]
MDKYVKTRVKVYPFHELHTQGILLQRRRLYQSIYPNWSVLCKRNEESSNHLFIHCEFSLKIWWRICAEFSLSWAIPGKILSWIHIVAQQQWRGCRKTLCNCTMWATLWAI